MAQIARKFILDNAVDETKIQLNNNSFLQALNAASATTDVIKLDGSDDIVFGSLPKDVTVPSVDAHLVNKKYVDDTAYNPEHENITLDSFDISNQYIDLANVVIDDSIIRGTTGRSRIKSLRAVGVKEVHMLISCPPTRHPCYYGIDFPSSTELIASQKSVEEIRESLDLDTLYYLSLEGMIKATGVNSDSFCKACFDGKYSVPPDTTFSKLSLGS